MSKQAVATGGLPEGWVSATFEDLLDYIQPSKYIVDSTEYDDKYKIPVLTAGKSFIIGYTNETRGVFDDLPVIIFDDFTTSIQFVKFQFKVKSSAMKILKPSCNLVSIQYVFYFMQTIRISVDTHKRYWISHYSQLAVPLPPLPEQHRIVARIEELFSDLDKGIESLKTAQQQLKVYRQAVLKWAFEGRLTNKDVKEGELPEGWKWEKVGNIAESMKNGLYRPAEVYSNDGVACLRMYNIESGKILWFDIKRMNLSTTEIEEYGLTEGDLLVNRVNSRELVGKTAYIKKYDEPIVYESKNIRLRLKKEVYGKYLNYWFLLSANKYFTSNAQQTVGMASINQKQLSDFEFPFPAYFNEQHRIVSEIEDRLSVCDKMEESISQSLQQAEALRQSILKKAFEGKLVPQDPKDEPASVLLERIRAEMDKSLKKTMGVRTKINKRE